ncbi:MAG: hypothetical protein IPH59_06815 [bacterium]|nr:hypothetical protein [bacterium]
MKKFAIVIQFALAALTLILASPPAESANPKAADVVVLDFFYQYIDYATPSDLPMHLRIAASVNAATDLAAAVGSDVDALTLMKHTRNPLVFMPASDTTYTWVGSSWVPDTRTTYSYTGGKKNTVMTEEYSGAVWQMRTNLVYSYNGSGYLSTYRLQNWSGTAWEDAFRYTTTYTGALPTETLTEHWDTGAWTNLSKTVNTYDGSSRVVTIQSYTWADPDWMELYKSTNTYDGAAI